MSEHEHQESYEAELTRFKDFLRQHPSGEFGADDWADFRHILPKTALPSDCRWTVERNAQPGMIAVKIYNVSGPDRKLESEYRLAIDVDE